MPRADTLDAVIATLSRVKQRCVYFVIVVKCCYLVLIFVFKYDDVIPSYCSCLDVLLRTML